MTLIQLRRGTAAQWTTANPVLAAGEVGLEVPAVSGQPVRTKVGDGTTAWNTLFYNDGAQLVTLTAPYTLASQTNSQKLFNASNSGEVQLAVGSYFFECFFTLSALSATSGSFGWDLTADTATIAGVAWTSTGNKAALATAASPQSTVNTAANTAIVTASTATTGWASIRGKVRISSAGGVIPSVSLGVAASAVVGADSYFRIWAAGSNTVTTVGNWT